MRLDVFLKLSRLIPRRTIAQEFCDKGLIEVNGAPAKSSKEIKAGDTVRIRRRNNATTIRVLDVPAIKQLAKNAAQELFEIVSTETIDGQDGLP